jgi:hypothetical protein
VARVFAGNEQLVDPEVFESVKRLSNDYFVFAEFDIDRRNIDWLIIRAATGSGDDQPSSAAILTEMKRVSAPVTGTVQDEWRVERLDGTVEVVGGGQEKNPYWQAVSAANALRAWLWNHHRLFCDDASRSADLQESNFSVWPDVLMLPRREQRLDHRLPVRPTNGFGMWWFDLERWLNHVETWRPNQRDRTRKYSEAELLRLSELFDTHEVHDGRKDKTPQAPVAIAPPPPIAPFEPVAAYFKALEDQVAALTTRVAQLEVVVDQLELAFPEQAPDAERPVNGNGDRNGQAMTIVAEPAREVAVPDDHADALIEIARGYADAGKRAVFPAVLKDLERRLGVSLKQSNYDGLGGARAWFDQAVERGIIRYGPEDESGAPTILPR